MALDDDVRAAFAAAQEHAEDGEIVSGVVPTEPETGVCVYLCSFERGEERRWLALDLARRPITDRRLVRGAVSIAALCELAEESAGGGDLGELRARLAELRTRENPEGIEEAEMAAAHLEETIRALPRVASVDYLDAIGLAATKLERALGEVASSPFAEAMKAAVAAAEELARDVERSYKQAFG